MPVEPQVFDLLVYLIENRNRVVSKDDLICSVWRGRIVSDSTIDSRINAVRKAIGDSGGQQGLVRTIARKGVRFVADVQQDQIGIMQVSREPGARDDERAHGTAAPERQVGNCDRPRFREHMLRRGHGSGVIGTDRRRVATDCADSPQAAFQAGGGVAPPTGTSKALAVARRGTGAQRGQ